MISLSRFAAYLLVLTLTTAQVSPTRLDQPSLRRSFHDEVYERDDSDARNGTNVSTFEIQKRGNFQHDRSVSSGDASYFQQAFIDLTNLVNYVAANPNAYALNRYFVPADHADVGRIFNTVRSMIQPGGIPQNQRDRGAGPYDLADFTLVRKHGTSPDLAESFNIEILRRGQGPPQIAVYDFGWSALYRRRRQDLRCGLNKEIGPRTDYKMHFLGSLLLHEILSVKIRFVEPYADTVTCYTLTSFLIGTSRPYHSLLGERSTLPLIDKIFQDCGDLTSRSMYLDDNPGTFPCTNKAYGPWESIQLLRRNSNDAKLNIENYVWYALVSG